MMEFEASCSCMGKTLDHFLQPTVLMLLTKEELHGFALIQKLGDTPIFNHTYPDPSGLYRYLKKMEQQGLLKSREEQQTDFPSKRIYSITELGRHCLANWANTLKDYSKRLDALTVLLERTVEGEEE